MTKIQGAFAGYTRNWGITLPKHVHEHEESDEMWSHDWRIQYRFGTDVQGEVLDFRASHRMTNDRHDRLYESGETEEPPGNHDMIMYPAGATAAQERATEEAYRRHDRDAAKELERKGFE